jgi:hypothetical protein
MTKEHIHNICKRIGDGKATEEEVCVLRDLALMGLQLTARVKTLIEDFDNPCFGGKIHNEIPHQIGLRVIEAVKAKS